MPQIIQQRRGTASQWTATNPVLADGEVGLEKDTNRRKTGDGFTAWSALQYDDQRSSIDRVPGLTAALALLQDKATAATDTEVASAVSAAQSALAASIALKQDASSAATDAEVEAVRSTLATSISALQSAVTTSLASKQDASLAATDVELEAVRATLAAADALKIPLSQKGVAGGVAALNSSGVVVDASGNPVSAGSGSVSDASTAAKGVVQLAGDLGGTASAPTVPGLALKAPQASPTFTGTPAAPTPTAGDNSTKIATTGFVGAAVAAVAGGGSAVADATTTAKGVIQLAGDLAGTASAPTVPQLATLTSAVAAKYTKPGAGIPVTDLEPTGLTEAAQDAVAAALIAGSGISIVYNDAGNTITIGATGSGGSGATLPAHLVDVTAAPYNAKADHKIAADASITAGASTLTTVSNQFASSDVGKLVWVARAGAAISGTTDVASMAGTITGFTDAKTVTVSFVATTTVSAGQAGWGTDNGAAIQAAHDSAFANADGGTILLPRGAMAFGTEPVCKSNVSWLGAGMRATTLVPVGLNVSGFRCNYEIDGVRVFNTHFRDIGILGLGQTASNQTSNTTKGFRYTGASRATYQNIWIRDTGATGFANDAPVDSMVHNVVVERAGRLKGVGDPGGNGFGVGCGGDDINSCTYSACIARDCKNYGIFFEKQPSGSLFTRSFKVYGCHVEGGRYGLGSCGDRNGVYIGNTIIGCTQAGIAINGGTLNTIPGREGLFGWNQISGCKVGIQYNDDPGADGATPEVVGNILICHNRISGCTTTANTGNYGISINAYNRPVHNVVLESNHIYGGKNAGIKWQRSTTSGSYIDCAMVNNRVYNNGTGGTVTDNDGIRLDAPFTRPRFEGNVSFDNQATKTQRYGFAAGSAFTSTGGSISRNDFRNNNTGNYLLADPTVIGATTAVSSNLGFVVVAPATETPTASPWTRATKEVPEFLHLSGGVVTNVTIGGVSVAASSDVAIPLEPGDAPVVTYSTVPTVSARRR